MTNYAFVAYRPTDNRACCGFRYQDGKLIGTQSNYCPYYLNPQFGGAKVENGRLIGFDGQDVTEYVREDIDSAHSFDFTGIPQVAFLGKK